MKRKFLLGAFSLLSALALVTGCSPDKPSSTKTSSSSSKSEVSSGASEAKYTDIKELKEKYDVIIVGAGGAGMTAAIEAKDKGLNPVVFEKMPVAGGNTLKASAGMNAAETKFEKEKNVTDSKDLFFEETLKGGGGKNDQELLRFFVDNSASAIDWLDQNGMKLDNLTTTGGMSVTRTHRPTDGSAVGGYLVKGLLENIHKRNIPLFVNADVTKINEKDGKISGVEVTFDQKDKKEISSNAVIVTTGGFGANEEMIKKYRPDLVGYVSTNQEGSTGDGIKMIEALGGATVDLDQIQIHPTVVQKNGYLITEAVRGEGAILVNGEGKRFFNEMETRDKVSKAILETKEKSAYLILDSGVKERVKAIATYEKQGFVVEGKTIAELAEKIKLPAEALEATVNEWNKSVADKQDTAFGRKTAMENDLSKAPYYAIQIAPGIHHTMGGVKINTKTEVLNKDGKAITGLFAAGEVTGGLHGANRIGGNAVADIIIFGRQAGSQSAEFVEGLKK
ncbi:fumarate reductase flavoprotein subunit [Pilibacter termitis]|uniref:Fumarate reductase flavoprotein subunit n=1 Tax=Pilibacter termitis TaxID=263852 RepID=A0A1T4QK45_9ENTE|nr:flavocytochrome c [Pilibacter termitis]SKA04007.1 fumarate reductase flavoprotein subunit [Pilibacter termitis]